MTETVGHHSANVAMLCNALSGGQASRGLLLAALLHDLPEQFTGDVPLPFKRAYPDIREDLDLAEDMFFQGHGISVPILTEKEEHILKAADILDCAFTSLREVGMGNTSLQMPLETSIHLCAGVCLPQAAQAVFAGLLEGIYSEAERRGISLR